MNAIAIFQHSCLSLLLGTAVCLSSIECWQPPAQAKPGMQSTAFTSTITKLKQSGQRWIEIDRSRQRLFAWEGNRPVYAILVSTGKASTPTPIGKFTVLERHRSTRMQGEDYDVPDVPYVMYYHQGYAIHGAYWHRQFGTPISHGCTNVAVNHARWLFNWATIGTPIVVRD